MDGSLGLALPDRRALVTGAGRGIGKAIALALARAGADIVLLGRSESDLAEVAVTIRGFCRKAEVLICDLLHPPDPSELIGRLCRIDSPVNNSWLNSPEPLETE